MEKGQVRVQIFTAAVGDYPMAGTYVKNLFKGFRQHLSHPIDFHVITDIPEVHALEARGEHNLICHKPALNVWGWWNLMELYRPDAQWSAGPRIMCGLDTIIRGNMDWVLRDRATFLKPFADEFGRKGPFNGTYADGLVYIPEGDGFGKVWIEWLGEDHAKTHVEQRKWAMHPWVTEVIKEQYTEAQQPDLWQDVTQGKLRSYKTPHRLIEEPTEPLVIFHGEPRPHKAAIETPWVAKYFPIPKAQEVEEVYPELLKKARDGPQKKVAVLANGPSLPDMWSEDMREDYDIVIGVNTAAWVYPVDIWCVLDPAVVTLGLPKIEENGLKVPETFATHSHFKKIPEGAKHLDLPWYNKGNKHLPEGLLREHGIKACNFTFPNALYVASLLSNGGYVDVYGMDMTTESDFQKKWGDRSGGRWKRELPWVIAAWKPHWRIYGKASHIIREVLYGREPFAKLLAFFEKYEGGVERQNKQLPEQQAAKREKLKKMGLPV
jgi:hypothetical protein